MADRAFNKTLGRDESISEALAEKDAGRNYEYVCADEKCKATMFTRKGMTPAFYASRLNGHRDQCPFASCTHSNTKPASNILNWYQELEQKSNLPSDHKSDKRNVSVGKFAEYPRLAHTAQAIYNFQRSKELDEYIDAEETQTILNFCISPRSAYFFEQHPEQITGLHLIVGRIQFIRYFDGFVILHVSTKGQKARELRIKIVFAGNWCQVIYETIRSKMQKSNIIGQELCVLCELTPKTEHIPFKIGNESKNYKINFEGNVTGNRQFYIPLIKEKP